MPGKILICFVTSHFIRANFDLKFEMFDLFPSFVLLCFIRWQNILLVDFALSSLNPSTNINGNFIVQHRFLFCTVKCRYFIHITHCSAFRAFSFFFNFFLEKMINFFSPFFFDILNKIGFCARSMGFCACLPMCSGVEFRCTNTF